MALVRMNTTKGSVGYDVPAHWQEIKEPELRSFENVGDRLVGRLLHLALERIKDKDSGKERDVLHATFEDGDGSLVKIRPSFDLRQKLGKRLLGKRMLVIYDGDNDATRDKGNAMKVFRVFVEHEGADGYVASDDDLPENMR